MDDSYISALPQAPVFTVLDGTVREADEAAAALGFPPGAELKPAFFEPDADGVIRLTADGRLFTLRVRQVDGVKLCTLFPAEEPSDPPAVDLGALSRASGAIRRSLQEMLVCFEHLTDRLDLDDRDTLNACGAAMRSFYQIERTAAHLNLFHLLQSGTYPLRRTRIDLGSKLFSLADEAIYLLQSCGVRLHVKLPPVPTYAAADWSLISLILWELLANAAAAPDSDAELEAVCRGKQTLTVSLRCPLVRPLPELVMERWSAEPESPAEQERTGMGLTLAADAAKLHGGSLLLSAGSDGRLTALVRIRLSDCEDQSLGAGPVSPVTSMDEGLTLLSSVLPKEVYDPRGL